MISSTFPAFLFFLYYLYLLTLSDAASVVRYNCGGLALGNYDADPASFVQGPDKVYRGPTKPGLTVGASHRWGTTEGFMYNIPTGNGTFNIDLIFAEVYKPTQVIGARRFNVAIEDDVKFRNLDVFKEKGADKELTKTARNVVVDDEELTIAFIQGASENPMVSAIIITRSDGSDFTIGGSIVTGEGTGTTSGGSTGKFDHQAHAVGGGPYRDVDYNGDGKTTVKIDGRGSHSHYNNPDTGESGRIVSYKWVLDDRVLSTKPVFRGQFPVGRNILKLTVADQKGDTATADALVDVQPALAAGAYCYYYQGVKYDELTQRLRVGPDGPRPDEAHSAAKIKFRDDEFPYTKKDQAADGTAGESEWAVRCVSSISSTVTQMANLTIEYRGGGASLYVRNSRKARSGASEDDKKRTSATVTLGVGLTMFQVIFYKSMGTEDPHLIFYINGKVAKAAQMSYRVAGIVPTVTSLSRSTVNVDGGGKLQLTGTGFFTNTRVKIGGKVVTPIVKISSTTLQVESVPPASGRADSAVDVVVETNSWESNVRTLSYNTNAEQGVSWDQTHFTNTDGSRFAIKQISCITIGPDGRYYMGSVNSRVYKLRVGKDLVVREQCVSDKLSPPEYNRAILGIAFNPAARDFRIYVTTNSLYWDFSLPFKGQPGGWANGAVEALVGPGKSGCENECLCYDRVVVSGLPVSNHDHGVNSLLFKGNDLLIGVGGVTNAGHNTEGNKLGGGDESPLSGAIVIAKLSLGSSFDGNIKYSNIGNEGKSRQTGGDVEVYASGFRNTFAMTMDTQGRIWATDNGGNFGYGNISISCTESIPFGRKEFDELNLIERGKHYGHPNRNRGQCVHGQGTPPKALTVSSTTGVTEYTGNAFGSNLKGKLILSKFSASGPGLTYEGVYDKAADEVKLSQMTEYSGLSVITGLHGELIMPRVQQHFIAVLKPKYRAKSGPFVMNVSPRRAYSGATVFISGENFASGITVRFGSKTATNVNVMSSTFLSCRVPSGSGVVAVTVEVSGARSTAEAGGDFIYV